MNCETILDVLDAGREVVDIGQIEKDAKRMLGRMVRRGEVIRDWSYRFPAPKRAYFRP